MDVTLASYLFKNQNDKLNNELILLTGSYCSAR